MKIIYFLIAIGLLAIWPIATKADYFKIQPIIDGGQNSTHENVSFSTIEKGHYGDIRERKAVRIKNSSEWQTFWQQLHGNQYPLPPLPQVDFNQYEVLGVLAGQKPTGGYSITITQIIDQGNYLEVYINEKIPTPGGIVTQVITSPYHLVEINKTNKTIVFPLPLVQTYPNYSDPILKNPPAYFYKPYYPAAVQKIQPYPTYKSQYITPKIQSQNYQNYSVSVNSAF